MPCPDAAATLGALPERPPSIALAHYGGIHPRGQGMARRVRGSLFSFAPPTGLGYILLPTRASYGAGCPRWQPALAMHTRSKLLHFNNIRLRWRWTLPSLLLLSACSSKVSETQGPELVTFVIVDTMRRDALGCYGREHAGTPVMDGLAESGTRFDQAISASGWTLPSVASMLTGTWPSMHKALGKVSRLTPITADLPVAAEVYASHGYHTIGFANAAFLSPLLGLDRGFDEFDHEHAYNKSSRRADVTVQAALQALEAHAEEKVFLLLHLFDPHLNYDPPEGYLEPFVGARNTPPAPLSMNVCKSMEGLDGRPPSSADIEYMRAVYQGEVAFVDHALGSFVEGLKELDRWEQTTLLITSDHGEEFWEHGGFEHGHTLFDELVHIPWILHAPGQKGISARRIERQVRSIDMMPTLFELAGFEPAPSFIGQSLVPELRGAASGEVPPAFSQSTLYGRDVLAWRHAGYGLIHSVSSRGIPRTRLYDLDADPRQLHDLSRNEAQLTQELLTELTEFNQELEQLSKRFSTPQLRSMGPGEVEQYEDSLEKLGYTGRDSD